MPFQEWRSNELGKVGGDRIKLMNLLDEAKRKISRIKDEWAPCDLFAMAVALDHNCVKKSTNFNVRYSQTRLQRKSLGIAFLIVVNRSNNKYLLTSRLCL